MSEPVILNNYNLPDALIGQTEKIRSNSSTSQKNGMATDASAFRSILSEKLNSGISFSKHANMRVEERDINLSGTDLERLENACEKARDKGINDALILMNGSAFIVNAPNKVVITVVNQEEMENKVITNIDGAVLI